ncbi:helix-turn-helix domain-containing protein [Salicibibacter cibarius]|uniref:Helix-turn-helix domain-containing protein n=1 Tax=Salicibibacter cibarius TaxID=2743000 RepID=A0A7T6Z2Q5_9BACI|nr:helix-turn-helix domain-containing protein [Salicibibacter cibarius]QQK75850.1 helix-turn-helix domain-containing protein [Salicibibacter cibarius]
MLKFNSIDELKSYVSENVLSSGEAAEYLGVSKQALQSLVKREKVEIIKEIPRDRLFLKSDLDKRLEESKSLRDKYRPYDK